MIFEVSIMHHTDVTGRPAQSCSDRRTLALIRVVPSKNDAVIFSSNALEHLPCAVGAAIVHYDRLQRANQLMLKCQQATQSSSYEMALVVHGNEHTKGKRRGPLALVI